MLMSKQAESKRGVATSQLVIVALVIIAALIIGVAWAHSKNDKTQNSTSTNSAKTQTSVNQNSPKFTFKEFGVAVTLPPALQGLKYTVSTPPATANAPSIVLLKLEMDNYTKLANKCTGQPAGTEQSFATLIKSPVVPGAQPAVENLKQFDSFYIGNLGGALQNPTCKDDTTKKSLVDTTNTLNAALKSAFATAQKV